MSGREDFLAAIRGADPEDDTATLIYADWLEEQGDDLPAAEIIRVQVELERGELRHGHEERRELLERERDLLKHHEARWKEELTRIASPRESAARVRWGPFCRGLVRSAALDLFGLDREVIGPNFDRIVRNTAVTELAFREEGLADLLETDAREEISGITITAGFALKDGRDGGHQALIETTSLPRLAALNLRGLGIGDGGLKSLRRATWFASLRSLNLRSNGLTAAALSSLPSEGLADLGLGMNRFSNEGVRVLDGRRSFSGLRCLELSYLDLDIESAELIARGLRDGTARRLNLRANRIGDAGLIALLRSGALENVTDLDVNFNRITDRGARELIRSASLPPWVRLDIGLNDLGPRTKRELRERFGDQVFVGLEAKPG